MTTIANLYVDQGTDFLVALELETDQGDDYPVIDQQFFCQVRKMYSTTVLFEADLEVVVNGVTNEINLSFGSSVTRNIKPGKYQYDLIMINDNNITMKILEGLLFVLPTITQIEGS
jgi:hypothetical protein